MPAETPQPLRCPRCKAPAESTADVDAVLLGRVCERCEEDAPAEQSGVWDLPDGGGVT